jgi:hypothetical protein
VRGTICPRCCGEEREVTIDCPFDCTYLQESRRHETPAAKPGEAVPDADIRITESWLRDHHMLLLTLASALFSTAMENGRTVDRDVREALEALSKTYRTLQSGLYYESVPANPYAAQLYQRAQEAIAAFRREETERGGMSVTRDTDILGCIAFWRRMEYTTDNGRARCRAFLDFLRAQLEGFGATAPGAEAARSPLVLP